MLAFYTASLALINFSLIINLYALTPFVNSIAFFLVFKERLNRLHLIGMVLILGCIVLTGMSSSNKHDNDKNDDIEEPKISLLVPLALGLTNTLVFVGINLISRYLAISGYIKSTQLSADTMIVQGLVFATLFAIIPKTITVESFFALGFASLF